MNARRFSILPFAASLFAFVPACVLHNDSSGSFNFTVGGDKAERNETLPLELAAGEELRVVLPHGGIAVRVAEGEAPHLDAHWRAGGEDKAMAEAVLARYKLEFKRGQGSLSISEVGEPLEVKGSLSKKSYAPSVDLTLLVPPDVKLTAVSSSGDLSASGALGGCSLKSSYGNLAAEGVRGETTLETASGNVKLADIDAKSIEVASQYGDIEASRVRATNVRLATSSGNVRVRDVQGEMSLKSSYGDLAIEGSDGDLEAVTSSGNITLQSHGKAKRTLSTSYGDIAVRGALGDLSAVTSSGKVSIDEFDGNLRAVSSYGDVKIRGRLTALSAETNSGLVEVSAVAGSAVNSAWHISSSYGDVRLSLPSADFACQLEASASSGEVHCEGFESGDGKPLRKLGRALHGGGGSVEVKSSSGDVRIKLQ